MQATSLHALKSQALSRFGAGALHHLRMLARQVQPRGFRAVEFQEMTAAPQPPFSARDRRERTWIVGDFPATARIGLLHVLADAIERQYLRDWSIVIEELDRIARLGPVNYNDYRGKTISTIEKARLETEHKLRALGWTQSYNFCERLYSHLTQEISSPYGGIFGTTITKAEAQAFFAEELQRIFDEENLGYEFRDGYALRRGKRHTVTQTNKAEKTLADQRLDPARKHFSKALDYFHDRKKADHENTVKEAVCAVEAAAKRLFPDANANTLGDFIHWATDSNRKLFPKTIGQTFVGLYGFRGSGEGVAHGATSGGAVTAEIAEYVLAAAASQIIFLAALAKPDEEPPF